MVGIVFSEEGEAKNFYKKVLAKQKRSGGCTSYYSFSSLHTFFFDQLMVLTAISNPCHPMDSSFASTLSSSYYHRSTIIS
jgi:hypothetical protein